MDELINLKLDALLSQIPEYVPNTQLPDPNLIQFYKDEENRIFWVNNQIDETLLELVKMIIRYNKEDVGIEVKDRKPIKVFIDSPGGDVQALWTTINTINISKTPVWTINYCTAYSAAGDLVASGHRRFALPGTNFLLHNGSCGFSGQADVVASTKKYFDGLSKKLVDNLLSKTKIDAKVYKKKAVTDWYFDEEEALKLGVIDEIITDLDVLY